MEPFTAALLVWIILPIPLFILWIKAKRSFHGKTTKELAEKIAEKDELETQLADKTKKMEVLRDRFLPVTSLDEEILRLRNERAELSAKVQEVRSSYSKKHKLFSALEKQVAIYDEQISFAELGFYEPHFDYGDSETYKTQIKKIRSQQKEMVTAKTASICPSNWSVDGSQSKGQTMINRQTRLTMRAFNNECDAAIANARWNNVVAMEKRILNAAKQINAANSSMNLELSEGYVGLKLQELHSTHEYRERLKVEKDERAETSRADREEKKLLAEAQSAL